VQPVEPCVLPGTAMGTYVACMFATILVGAYEERVIWPMLSELEIVFYRLFIDNGFGVNH
jgi:hypothetical protein